MTRRRGDCWGLSSALKFTGPPARPRRLRRQGHRREGRASNIDPTPAHGASPSIHAKFWLGTLSAGRSMGQDTKPASLGCLRQTELLPAPWSTCTLVTNPCAMPFDLSVNTDLARKAEYLHAERRLAGFDFTIGQDRSGSGRAGRVVGDRSLAQPVRAPREPTSSVRRIADAHGGAGRGTEGRLEGDHREFARRPRPAPDAAKATFDTGGASKPIFHLARPAFAGETNSNFSVVEIGQSH